MKRLHVVSALLLSATLACQARDAKSSAAVAAADAPSPSPAPALAMKEEVARDVGEARFAATAGERPGAPPLQAPRARDGRKIVRTGALSLVVDDYAAVRAQLDALLRGSGGFVASAQVGHEDGRVTTATLVIRVPADGYESLAGKLATLGTVEAETSSAEDVTGEWVDVTARLANARKLEGRLVELVATEAGNVSQLLEVERELARVREQIELWEGRLKVLDDQVTLSTLTLTVRTRVPYVAALTPSLGDDASRRLDGSIAAMAGLGRDLLLAIVGLLPWSPLLVAGVLVLRHLRRRLRPARA